MMKFYWNLHFAIVYWKLHALRGYTHLFVKPRINSNQNNPFSHIQFVFILRSNFFLHADNPILLLLKHQLKFMNYLLEICSCFKQLSAGLWLGKLLPCNPACFIWVKWWWQSMDTCIKSVVQKQEGAESTCLLSPWLQWNLAVYASNPGFLDPNHVFSNKILLLITNVHQI